MAMTHQAAESRALGNAKDLYNQAKELIDAGDSPATARQVDNLLVLAKLSAEIAQAEALTALAAAAERLTFPLFASTEHQYLYGDGGELVATTDFTKEQVHG